MKTFTFLLLLKIILIAPSTCNIFAIYREIKMKIKDGSIFIKPEVNKDILEGEQPLSVSKASEGDIIFANFLGVLNLGEEEVDREYSFGDAMNEVIMEFDETELHDELGTIGVNFSGSLNFSLQAEQDDLLDDQKFQAALKDNGVQYYSSDLKSWIFLELAAVEITFKTYLAGIENGAPVQPPLNRDNESFVSDSLSRENSLNSISTVETVSEDIDETIDSPIISDDRKLKTTEKDMHDIPIDLKADSDTDVMKNMKNQINKLINKTFNKMKFKSKSKI